ncbi:MAG: hypothetical protein N3A61_08420, partial [Ignavibacteria bacterium]|nr:hypothetical protein [Ignavibacteria bacterium]
MSSKFSLILIMTVIFFGMSILSNSINAQTKDNSSTKNKSEMKIEKNTDSKKVSDKKADGKPFNKVCP